MADTKKRGFTSETARLAGKKSRPGRQFAVLFREEFGKDKSAIEAFVEASKRIRSHLLNPAEVKDINGKKTKFLSKEQISEIYALQPLLTKGVDKLVPTLTDADINVENTKNYKVFVLPKTNTDPFANLDLGDGDDESGN